KTPANTNGKLLNEPGLNCAFVVLETVTVNGTVKEVELRFAGLGATVQVAPPGAPVQVKFTAPVKPTTPFRVKLYVAVPPAPMVWAGAVVDMVKGAVTLMVTGAEVAAL